MANSIESVPFYYDSGIAGQLGYRDYQQKVAMTQDITDSITENTNRSIEANAFNTDMINSRLVDMQIASTNAMYNNSQAMMGAFYDGLSGVSNQIQSGFSNVSRQIGVMSANMGMAFAALNSSVQKSAQVICDKLDTMNDILNNPSLAKTRELYRRAVVNYDKGFYEEARDDLKEALSSNKTDYISWFLLGKTYLFGTGEFSTVIDLDAAVDAMKNAVKFITPDARKQAEARAMAAEMCFFLGLAQQIKAMDLLHVQNKQECDSYLEQAGGSYSQSYDYSAQMLEARYNRARCKALLGDVQGAIEDLEWLILQDRTYCIKVCADNDFTGIMAQFTDLVKKLKMAVFVPAKKDYDYIQTMLSELASLGGRTSVTIPSTFTEELPYFDVLDFAPKFRELVPIAEKELADKKAEIERERLAKEKAEQEARDAEKRADFLSKNPRKHFTKYQGCIGTKSWITFGLKADGTVAVAGRPYFGSDYYTRNVSGWRDIVAFFINHRIVGLKADGTVVAAGDNDKGQCNVSDWRDIIAVAAGWYHTVGLKTDGTVVSTGKKDKGQCNISGWRDIIAVAASWDYTVGLKTDGTVVSTGDNDKGQCNVSGWRDIVAVSVDNKYTVGLKADGTVVAVGNNENGQCNVSGWRDIVAVSANFKYTIGLKADGTVVATGNNDEGQCNVSGWRDIVAVSTGTHRTVGLKADGTVVTTGANDEGQSNVSEWRDIVAVAATTFTHTVGLKADGTVVAVGKNENGECNVNDWRDIGPVNKELLGKKLEKVRQEKAEREALEKSREEQQMQWARQGLCYYCGGELKGVFTKKCKSCGKVIWGG